MKKTLCLLLILSIIMSCLPIHIFAYNSSSSYSVTIGTQKLPFSDYPAGSYFTDNGKACTDHNECGAGISPFTAANEGACNCKYTYNGVQLLSSSCYAFANMVFYRLFGHTTYSNTTRVLSSISTGSINTSYLYNLFSGSSIKPGAHIRTGAGHSMIFMGYDSSYIYTYEGNYDSQCRVGVISRTWSEFSTYLSSRNGIAFVEMPNNYTGSSSSNQTPGKPELIDVSPYYRTNKPITFTWNATQNTTHYNIYIQKYNGGTYSMYEAIHYAESGVARTLPAGSYRVQLQSTNSNYNWAYTDGDWQYFTVLEQIEKPELNTISPYYRNDKQICFTWSPTKDTTHYNVYIQKLMDGTYSMYEPIHYAESGIARTLPVGSYRVQLQSTNSHCYTDDGSSWLYSNSDWEYFKVIKEIEKPMLDQLQEIYSENDKIMFKWLPTEDTTHYNVYIQKLTDETYSMYEPIHYAESGVARILPAGNYRVQLQSTNSYCYADDGSNWLYKNGDWEYFTVYPSTTYITAKVTTLNSNYNIEISLYNLTEECDIIIVGYKKDKFITMDCATRSGQLAYCTLSGDIDEIKVIVWENMSNLKPLCDAVVIPQSEWINLY